MLSSFLQHSTASQINATAKAVTEIDILPNEFANVHTVRLSNNRITNLTNIEQFRSIQSLYLDANLIRHVEALNPLRNCRTLEHIYLQHNPVEHIPMFHARLLMLVPSLKTIDNQPVSKYVGNRVLLQKQFVLIELESFIISSYIACSHVCAILEIVLTNRYFTVSIAKAIYKRLDESDITCTLREVCRVGDPLQYILQLKDALIFMNSKTFNNAKRMTFHVNLLREHKMIIELMDETSDVEKLLKLVKRLKVCLDRYLDANASLSEALFAPSAGSETQRHVKIDAINDYVEDIYDNDSHDLTSERYNTDDYARKYSDLNITDNAYLTCPASDEENNGDVDEVKINKKSFKIGGSKQGNTIEQSDASDFDQPPPVRKPSMPKIESTESIAKAGDHYTSKGSGVQFKDSLLNISKTEEFLASRGEDFSDDDSSQEIILSSGTASDFDDVKKPIYKLKVMPSFNLERFFIIWRKKCIVNIIAKKRILKKLTCIDQFSSKKALLERVKFQRQTNIRLKKNLEKLIIKVEEAKYKHDEVVAVRSPAKSPRQLSAIDKVRNSPMKGQLNRAYSPLSPRIPRVSPPNLQSPKDLSMTVRSQNAAQNYYDFCSKFSSRSPANDTIVSSRSKGSRDIPSMV